MDVLMLVVPFEKAGNTLGQGDFDLDARGRLSREGPKRARPYVWTGVQMLAKRVVADPPAQVFSTNLFWDRAIAAGRCYGLVHDGAWFDVGYPEAIALTEAALSHGG
jgi:MurNAc alpha-1-phosphate uridylyltransferase